MGAAPVAGFEGCCAAKDTDTEFDEHRSCEIFQDFDDAITNVRGGALGRPVLLSREGEGMAQKQQKQGKAVAVTADFVLTDEPKAQQPATTTEETKEAEKARLKKLLYDFIKRSTAGIPCIWVQNRGDQIERVNGWYSLDAAMAKLTVQGIGSEPTESTFTLPQIKDLYSIEADGEDCFPASVLAAVQPDERERLLMLIYCDDDVDKYHDECVCLLVESIEAREAFLECLKLLCICARVSA